MTALSDLPPSPRCWQTLSSAHPSPAAYSSSPLRTSSGTRTRLLLCARTPRRSSASTITSHGAVVPLALFSLEGASPLECTHPLRQVCSPTCASVRVRAYSSRRACPLRRARPCVSMRVRARPCASVRIPPGSHVLSDVHVRACPCASVRVRAHSSRRALPLRCARPCASKRIPPGVHVLSDAYVTFRHAYTFLPARAFSAYILSGVLLLSSPYMLSDAPVLP